MKSRRIFTVFGTVLASALALVACRAEEQGRITRYQPGVYLGKKDTQLTDAQRERLNQRAAAQGDTNYRTPGGGAGGGGVGGGLDTRVRQQGGTTP